MADACLPFAWWRIQKVIKLLATPTQPKVRSLCFHVIVYTFVTILVCYRKESVEMWGFVDVFLLSNTPA